MYDTSMRNIQHNAGKLTKLQEQMISKVNRPSDDPVGFTNVLRYGNVLSSLGQHQINMNDGEIFMSVMETTHDRMNNLFGRCNDLAVQASNDTMNHDQRLYSNLEVRQCLEQLVALAQTKHKDNYIFTGKWTNQVPYEIKKAEANFNAINNSLPNQNYSALPDTATVRLNPNPFMIEDPDNPPNPIPDPERNSVFDPGQTITIQLYDNNYLDPNLKPYPDNPLVQRIIPGTFELFANGEKLLEKPFKNTDLHEEHLDYDKPDYEIDYVNGTITLLSDRAKAAFYDHEDDDGDPDTPDIVFLRPQNELPKMEFEYVYRNSIDMTGEIYREIDTGITMKVNANPDNLFGKGGYDDTDAFKEIISLMQGLWYNEQSEIAKSIDNLDTAAKRNLAEQAVEGARLNRIDMTFERNAQLTIDNTKARSNIEDVDLSEALMNFTMANTVYEASLLAASRIMQSSLLNYL
ncbi:MAG: hypothetical protein LBB36_01355 [Fibromonadaceae bacterium]|jgi:flagellar hook-associated protein 3 FlgL|nr:hypothetical protein [Fibromonadaceae bacterium]